MPWHSVRNFRHDPVQALKIAAMLVVRVAARSKWYHSLMARATRLCIDCGTPLRTRRLTTERCSGCYHKVRRQRLAERSAQRTTRRCTCGEPITRQAKQCRACAVAARPVALEGPYWRPADHFCACGSPVTRRSAVKCRACYLAGPRPRKRAPVHVAAGNQRARKIFRDQTPVCACGLPAIDRHHRDGNPLNNDSTNVVWRCRRCHMEEDGRLDAMRERNTSGRRHPDHFCEGCGAKFKPNGQSTLQLRWCAACRRP